MEKIEIGTVDMHTGGEPVRIVTSGYPEIPGATILDKRRYAREKLDHLRRLLMFEPRGHAGMYGAIPVAPDHGRADLAVLFMHNEGYSTMCGHAVIALARWAVDKGLVKAEGTEAPVNIQCPCGLVRAYVAIGNGRPGRVRFESVPSFAAGLGRIVDTPDYGPVEVDIGYGGAFYAIAPADSLGLDVRTSPTRQLVDAATQLSEAVKARIGITHPEAPDLGYLYGTILTDGREAYAPEPTANICVFADAQVDRSPTGSGVSARIAVQYARKLIGLGQARAFESVTGALFTGKPLAETRVGPFPAVTVEVAGRAYYTGEAVFTVEEDDPLGQGFLLR